MRLGPLQQQAFITWMGGPQIAGYCALPAQPQLSCACTVQAARSNPRHQLLCVAGGMQHCGAAGTRSTLQQCDEAHTHTPQGL